MKTEPLVTTSTLAKELGVGMAYASALKQAAGFRGRFCDVAAVRKFWSKHPEFKMRDVFDGKVDTARARSIRASIAKRREDAFNAEHRCNRSNLQPATADKCGEQ